LKHSCKKIDFDLTSESSSSHESRSARLKELLKEKGSNCDSAASLAETSCSNDIEDLLFDGGDY
jgi:hypothetical protein